MDYYFQTVNLKIIFTHTVLVRYFVSTEFTEINQYLGMLSHKLNHRMVSGWNVL